MRIPTPQTLDPLGGLTARYFLFGISAIAAIVAALLLWAHSGDINNPFLQTAAIVVLLAGLVQSVAAGDPRNFPYGPVRHAAVIGTLLVAAGLDAASRPDGVAQAGAWGALCVAIVLFMSGSFRPAREILVVTVVAAAVIGVIAWLHLGALTQAAAAEQVIRQVTPVLAVGCGTAAFAHVLVRRISAWQRDHQLVPPPDMVAAVEMQRVRQDFVDYRVGPFLESILEAGTVTLVDTARARGLAAGLRQQMLRDASRSWLADSVDRFEGDRAVVDALTPDQRRVLGALIAELRAAPSLIENSMGAVASTDPATIVLSAALDTADLRAPAYRAVLGSAFAKARVDLVANSITITAQLER